MRSKSEEVASRASSNERLATIINEETKDMVHSPVPNRVKDTDDITIDASKKERRLAKKLHRDYVKRKNYKEPYRKAGTIGRNEMCPCGSGKKYKDCHKFQIVKEVLDARRVAYERANSNHSNPVQLGDSDSPVDGVPVPAEVSQDVQVPA